MRRLSLRHRGGSVGIEVPTRLSTADASMSGSIAGEIDRNQSTGSLDEWVVRLLGDFTRVGDFRSSVSGEVVGSGRRSG